VEILDVPYPASQDLRKRLAAAYQGVVQGRRRPASHVNGGATDQTNYMLDGFNISDPVSGPAGSCG